MLLSERIRTSGEAKHHVQLLKLYLKREAEYRAACEEGLSSAVDFKYALHRFKSALGYIANDVIVEKVNHLEENAEQGYDWRKEELNAFFLDLDDLLESVKAYIIEHENH